MSTFATFEQPVGNTDQLKVEGILKSLRPQLPIQNPMPFFVHNNPLQFWEQFPFQEGIEKAVIAYENTLEEKSRAVWRELEDFVIPLILCYFDQGLNSWNAPENKDGLWKWFCAYVDSSLKIKARTLRPLKKNLEEFRNQEPIQLIVKALKERDPSGDHWALHLQTLLFHFKGWSGMVQVLEKNPTLFPLKVHKISLVEWLAILVLAEHSIFVESGKVPRSLWSFSALGRRRKTLRRTLSKIKIRELNYYRGAIAELQKHLVGREQKLQRPRINSSPENTASVQVLFCIDDREESLRRALETVNDGYETFGTVGFFGVDFLLKRPGHVIFQPQCPPVVTPRKKAEEVSSQVKPNFLQTLRRYLPYLNESRFSFIEPVLALVAWPIYVAALLLRTLTPRLYYLIREELRLDHYLGAANKINFIDGYSLEEKIQLVAGILGGAGLKTLQAPFVVVLGHAASTTNNPFQKSYGCGACSGQSGFANAKVFAEFANDLDVRSGLTARGFVLGENVTFLAACHDTCADQVIYAPLEGDLSDSKQKIWKQFKDDMAQALVLNKNERWKEFQLTPVMSASFRSMDWAQPRPEFGHSRVALSVFGPRWLTKGVNLHRRAFLVSYEPSTDPDGSDLAFYILNALPVCANINLDYFTSSAFPEAMGAGSKLPLNIASGIGLMTGSKGDLRIGLATQMVDQHEPLRLLAFVYCEASKLEQVIAKSARIKSLIDNNWIHLIRIDPQTLRFEVLTEELKNGLSLFQ